MARPPFVPLLIFMSCVHKLILQSPFRRIERGYCATLPNYGVRSSYAQTLLIRQSCRSSPRIRDGEIESRKIIFKRRFEFSGSMQRTSVNGCLALDIHTGTPK